MGKIIYLVELTQQEAKALPFAAGAVAGLGMVPTSELLTNIYEKIQVLEVPDDFGPDGQDERPDLRVVENEMQVEPEEERDVDPNFAAGAATPPPPINRPEDFGAGPPPG